MTITLSPSLLSFPQVLNATGTFSMTSPDSNVKEGTIAVVCSIKDAYDEDGWGSVRRVVSAVVQSQ